MRYERVIIEAGGSTFTLDLHPRLTVIAGLGSLERQSLQAEILGALTGQRTGVHLEITDDDGRHLAVYRPREGRHRVVDVDAAVDVSAEFTGPDGTIDLLGPAGLNPRTARRLLRFGATDLVTEGQADEYARALAALDQDELWAAAEAVRGTEDTLGAEAEAVGSAPEHAETVERIEQHHQRFEAAQARHERTRRKTVLIGGIAAVAAVPATVVQPAVALLLLLVTVLSLVYALACRRMMTRAEVAEQEALAAAGAQSYLGFHLQRVNGMLSSAESRKRLVSAADSHREALEAWRTLAGGVDVEWALEHREAVIAAALMQREVRRYDAISTPLTAEAGDHVATLAHLLVTRMTDAARLGPARVSYPLVMDDPLAGLDVTAKPALLELVARGAGTPQVVYLTEDQDVASWARLESLTGEVAVIEPVAEHDPHAIRQEVPLH